VLLIITPILAWAAHLGGTVARRVTRAVLVLPLAAYAPVAVISGQLIERRPEVDRTLLAGVVRSLYWWGTFGPVAAVAVTLYLAALRRRDPRRSPWPALLVAPGVGAGALLAMVLQDFTTSYLATSYLATSYLATSYLTPNTLSATTPMTEMFLACFLRYGLGTGTAVSTLLLAVLVPVGVTVLIVLSGLRLEFDRAYRSADRPPGWPTSRAVGVFVGVGPLAPHAFVSIEKDHDLDTFLGLVPPTWLAIPTLFVLTLLFRGQALRAQALPQEGGQLPLRRQVLPALPMLALTFLVTWVVQARSLLWSSAEITTGKFDPGPKVLADTMWVSATYPGIRVPLDVGLSPVAVVLLFLLGLTVQLRYLDQIALRVGRPEHDTPLADVRAEPGRDTCAGGAGAQSGAHVTTRGPARADDG
jgi:hypothetical protein